MNQTVNGNTDRSNQNYAFILRIGGKSQPGPYLGTTSTSPGLASFMESGTGIGLENVHKALPRGAIQAGFMTVTALIDRQWDSEHERYKLTLDPDFGAADYFLEYDIIRRCLVEEHRRRVNKYILSHTIRSICNPTTGGVLVPIGIGQLYQVFSNGNLIDEAGSDQLSKGFNLIGLRRWYLWVKSHINAGKVGLCDAGDLSPEFMGFFHSLDTSISGSVTPLI